LKFLISTGSKKGGVEYVTEEMKSPRFKLERHTDFPVIKDQETDHIGIHKQKQGDLYWVRHLLSGGRIRNGTLAKSRRARRENTALPDRNQIRLTNKQNLLIINIPRPSSPRSVPTLMRSASTTSPRISAKAA